MIRVLIAAFFIGHGLVHGIMFSLPFSAQASADMPYNPSRFTASVATWPACTIQ